MGKRTGKPNGRPTVDIDQEHFELLCQAQGTEEEIAAHFNVSADTLARWCKRTYGQGFAEVFARKRGNGRLSVRRAHFQQCVAGNVRAIAIWGKQYLGYSDKVEQKHSGEVRQSWHLGTNADGSPRILEF